MIDPDLENETKNQKSVNFPPLEIMWSLSEWNTGFQNFGQIGDQLDHFFFYIRILESKMTIILGPEAQKSTEFSVFPQFRAPNRSFLETNTF